MKSRIRLSPTAGWERCSSALVLALAIGAFFICSHAIAGDTRRTLSPDLSSGTCSSSATTLCVSDNRFSVTVSWRVPSQARNGHGTSMPLSSDTGLFWFFDDSDIDLVMKVLDGTSVNGRYWVFFAGLSNVEYTITVIDLKTGSVKSYENPDGTFASVADISAFAGTSGAASGAVMERVETDDPSLEARSSELYAQFEALLKTARLSPRAGTPCAPGSSMLCLASSRFQVTVDWEVPSQGRSGQGAAVPISTDTGYFWFSSDSNVELVVKVVDGRPINGHFWIFAAALSNVQYTLRVTDTQTGVTKAWDNPEGQLASWSDTGDFSDTAPPPPPPQDLSGRWTGTIMSNGPKNTGGSCQGSAPFTVNLVESDGSLTGQLDTACGLYSLQGEIRGTALVGLLDGPDGQGLLSGLLMRPNRIQFQATLSSSDGNPGDHELIRVSLTR
jgi:hypothetical protein